MSFAWALYGSGGSGVGDDVGSDAEVSTGTTFAFKFKIVLQWSTEN